MLQAFSGAKPSSIECHDHSIAPKNRFLLITMEFASAIVQSLLDRLASYTFQEVCLAWGVENELKKLNKTLSIIRIVLQDAEKKQLQDARLTHWLGNLKDVCNDAEDVLDEYEFRNLRLKVLTDEQQSVKGKVHNFFSRWNPVVFNFKMGHKVKVIREMLDEIDKEKTQFSLDKVAEPAEDDHVSQIRETDSLPEPYVIGRAKEKKQIITYLLKDNDSSGNENVSVISIFGLGGLGKTTLAKMVYNDVVVEERFPMRLWVCVSEKFDMHTLVKGIIVESKKECNCGSLNLMKRGLLDILRDTKFLLVLDDVWEIESTGITVQKWAGLKTLLDVGDKRSKIIVTTRDESVASLVQPIHKHSLGGLSPKDSMTLFTRNAFNIGDGQHERRLIKIGEGIVERCRGVPLALATLGCLLHSKREDYWLQVKDEMWNVPGGDIIMAALRLSYNALPSHLKPCFAFCSLYPKDYLFLSEEIVPLWMAQGYLKFSGKNEDFQEVGLDYIRQFFFKSLFQIENDAKIRIKYKIHDLVHDLAVLVARTEFSTVNCRSWSNFKKVRHLSLLAKDWPGEEAQVPEFILQLEKLRTILLHADFYDAETCNQYFLRTCVSRFTYMRALDLRDSTLKKLPCSIGNLTHLRYLNLWGNYKIKKLPTSICKLLNLHFLSLGACTALEELPEGIGNLINLRYLEITTLQVELPKGIFRRLTSVQFLYIRECANLKSLGQEIGYLINLRQLRISRCGDLESLPPNMEKLTSLHTLGIMRCKKLELMRSGQGIKNLRAFSVVELDLEALPNWLQDSADTLQSIIITECQNLTALPQWVQNLTLLEQLEIRVCPQLSALPQGMHQLKELIIGKCPELSKRCERETGEDWPKIKHVPKIFLDDSDYW